MQITIQQFIDEIDNEDFIAYHKKYPNVYEKFVELTFKTRNKGFKRFSARGVFQVMRWLMQDQKKTDGFKFNNNYTPYYVRLLEFEHPEFIGFYEKRKVKRNSLVLKESM